MAMPRLPDLVNKMIFQGHQATIAIRFANLPEFLLAPSQESHLALLTSEVLHFPDYLMGQATQKRRAPVQAHNALSPENHYAKQPPPPAHLYLDR